LEGANLVDYQWCFTGRGGDSRVSLSLHLERRTGRGRAGGQMNTPTWVTEARLALGRRLAILRHDAGFTQAHAAHKIGYSRGGVARGEA
jgi:hypothetical protein